MVEEKVIQRAHVDTVDPATGERIVAVNYNFGDSEYYRSYGGRGGNRASLGMELPESQANVLKEIIKRDPAFARDLMERAVMTQADDTDYRAWFKGAPHTPELRNKPPYEQLPEDWTISILDITSEQRPAGIRPTSRGLYDPDYEHFEMTKLPAPRY